MENGHENALVSAIITTHDRKELAEKAIKSVQNQTYKNIELIVVDDRSTQENSAYIRTISERDGFRYIYIPAEESKGGNHARNVGIENSSGEYIAFLDDDDEWMPQKTEKQVEYLQENPDYGVVSCLRMREIDYSRNLPETREKIEGDVSELIFTCTPYMTSTIMVNKSLLNQCGMFDEDLKYWQDYEFGIRFSQHSKVGCVKECLCLYRIVHSDKKKLSNQLVGWEEAVSYIDDKHRSLIDELPKEIAIKHQLLIAKDGQNRANNIGDRRKKISYSIEVLRLQPTVKNAGKLILSLIGIKWKISYN